MDPKDPTPVAPTISAATEATEDYYDPNKVSNKKPTNQFNYSDRASQTNNNPLRDRTTMTEPPPRVNFSANANQWEIFDAYQEDFEENVGFYFTLNIIHSIINFIYFLIFTAKEARKSKTIKDKKTCR